MNSVTWTLAAKWYTIQVHYFHSFTNGNCKFILIAVFGKVNAINIWFNILFENANAKRNWSWIFSTILWAHLCKIKWYFFSSWWGLNEHYIVDLIWLFKKCHGKMLFCYTSWNLQQWQRVIKSRGRKMDSINVLLLPV